MHDILSLDSYPLDRPGSAEWQALVAQAQADLAATGMFNLEGFFRPAAVAALATSLAPKFAQEAYTHARRHNIYFRKSIDALPADHPALVEVETRNQTLCADQLDGPLSRLYHWPAFATFLAATMGKEALHPMADPLAAVNAMAYRAGEGLNWHFDRSEFTTTLLLQAPKAGGLFEYRTDLRSETDPNYEGVARLLRGQDPQMQTMQVSPGTLNVFRGKHTAHRVTPVEGDRPRMIAVFSYFDRPGVRFTAEEQRGFYGRAA